MVTVAAIVPAIVKSLTVALLLLLIMPAASRASISVSRSTTRAGSLNVVVIREPLSIAVRALELYLRKPVEIVSSGDPLVSFSARAVRPEAALSALALSGGATVVERRDRTVILTAGPTVTLDVKDADVRSILRSLKEQCGVRNLVIDPNVTGSGTFLLRDIPCRRAFDVVFGMMGLRASYEPNSVVTVSLRR